VSITVSRTAESRDAGDALWDLQVRTAGHAGTSNAALADVKRWSLLPG